MAFQDETLLVMSCCCQSLKWECCVSLMRGMMLPEQSVFLQHEVRRVLSLSLLLQILMGHPLIFCPFYHLAPLLPPSISPPFPSRSASSVFRADPIVRRPLSYEVKPVPTIAVPSLPSLHRSLLPKYVLTCTYI